jgi:hypothetical protein
MILKHFVCAGEQSKICLNRTNRQNCKRQDLQYSVLFSKINTKIWNHFFDTVFEETKQNTQISIIYPIHSFTTHTHTHTHFLLSFFKLFWLVFVLVLCEFEFVIDLFCVCVDNDRDLSCCETKCT